VRGKAEEKGVPAGLPRKKAPKIKGGGGFSKRILLTKEKQGGGGDCSLWQGKRIS